MELSGLQIFKYLPGGKKQPEANCKKCGYPTCMAFSLNVAKKQVSIDKCEYAPQELLDILQSALKIQQNELRFGQNNEIKMGGETVMFRHDKTFVNKTVIAITLNSNDKNLDQKLDQIKKYSIDRIGEIFKIDAINLVDNGNLIEAATKISNLGLGLIVETEDEKAILELEKYNPIIKSNTINKNLINAAVGKNIDELDQKSQSLIDNKVKKIALFLDTNKKPVQQIVEELTYLRRLAIKEKLEPFAYPVITKIEGKDIFKTTAIASLLMCRYSNMIILEEFNEALFTTLLTLRQNLFTDPQKPLQVESKVYEVNEPDENAIVMMTTNFALTYFAVLSEVESSSFPTYIVITPSDGMSVLTAWSADKFTPEMAAKMIKESDILQKVKNKKIIIPGLLSHMKEELEEAIVGWDILVGPNEAYQLPDFVKNNLEK